MKQDLTAQDVLNDIQFELAQGAISKDELGRGITQVKVYQNRLRSDVFQAEQAMPQLREIIGRQFQLNDMLLTLLQEMAASLQEMQLKSLRLGEWQPNNTAVQPSPILQSAPAAPPDLALWRDTADLEQARAERLEIQIEVRPTNIPLIGGLLHRLKYEMHGLIIFYLQKLAHKQTAVNRTYGDWLLYFDALHQHQDTQLRAQLGELQNRLAKLEGEANKEG